MDLTPKVRAYCTFGTLYLSDTPLNETWKSNRKMAAVRSVAATGLANIKIFQDVGKCKIISC